MWATILASKIIALAAAAAAAAAAVRNEVESLPVRFAAPRDGATLASSADPVTFRFEVASWALGNLSASDETEPSNRVTVKLRTQVTASTSFE